MADKDTMVWMLRRPVKSFLAWLAGAKPQPFPADAQRILVVREGGFGDLILTMPILRALRQHVGPDVTIDLLVREPVAGMMADNGVTNNLYAKGNNLFRAVPTILAMRRRRCQAVVDLVSSPSLSFALWILAAAPRAHRSGGDKAELRGMYHQHVELPPRPSIHFMERLRRIAAFATGDAPVCDDIPWFSWPEGVRTQADLVWQSVVHKSNSGTQSGRVVLVNLSAGLPRRTWPDRSYRELLSDLVPRYEGRIQSWIITSSPADRPRAEALTAALNRPEVVILPPQSDFRVIAALAGRADVVLTPDTSLVHAASAAGIPVVGYTVAENVISWAPWKIPHEVVAAPPGMTVSAIPVSEVAAAFDRLLSKLPRRP
ncbi:MAG: glycosyltransferase family 9 protein [candidate division Zixibacteria bacterium]|nr:glycosyltransferase family 9 protein [candidate division Zixibacteria bacterium]